MDKETAHRLLAVSHLVASEVGSPSDPADALSAVVELAARTIPQARAASISVGYERGGFRTVASSDERALRADEIQYARGNGPCMAAAVSGEIVMTPDLALDPRWPAMGRLASAETGLHSVLSTRLTMTDEEPAGLNLYSPQVDAFADDPSLLLSVFAAHAATALEAVRARQRAASLERELQTSRDIGTAVGILMSAYKLRRAEALELLRIAGQGSFRKPQEIAREVIETKTLRLPEHPPGLRR
jgi:GAF domain-containing protein